MNPFLQTTSALTQRCARCCNEIDGLVARHLCAHRYEYATTMSPGPCVVRPWQLGWRADFGFAGFCEPDETLDLLEMIMAEGCLPQLH